MLALILVTLFINGCLSATTTSMPTTRKPHHGHGNHTHAPKPTHEPDVAHSVQFHYDHVTHMMAVRTYTGQTRLCYLLDLNGQQQLDVHSSHGLFAIEKMIIDKIDTGAMTTDVSHDDIMAMSHGLAKFCLAKFSIKKFM